MLLKQVAYKENHRFKKIKAKNNQNRRIKDHNQQLIIELQKVKRMKINQKLVMIKKLKIQKRNKIKKCKFNQNQN